MRIETLMVGPIMTNCYLLFDEQAKVCAVIDSGDEGERSAAAVENSGCTLQYVLLTHGHYDHFTGLAALLDRYPDIPVYIHPADAVEKNTNPWALKFPRLGEKNQRCYVEGDPLIFGSLMIQVH